MDLQNVRAALEGQLEELLSRAGHLGADLAVPHSADSEEAAVEAEADEALLGQNALVELEISQVRAALSRLEDGNYGVCVTCGDDIAPARLAAMPCRRSGRDPRCRRVRCVDVVHLQLAPARGRSAGGRRTLRTHPQAADVR